MAPLNRFERGAKIGVRKDTRFGVDRIHAEIEQAMRQDAILRTNLARSRVGAPLAKHTGAPAPDMFSPGVLQVDKWLKDAEQRRMQTAAVPRNPLRVWTLIPWVLGAGAVIFGLLSVSRAAMRAKEVVINDGEAAVHSLREAQRNLEQYNLAAAADHFTDARERFQHAADELGVVGSGVGDILSNLPGGGKIRSASNLVRAGQLVAQAGQALTQAGSMLATTGTVLNPGGPSLQSFSEALVAMDAALKEADSDIRDASSLLDAVDVTMLPEDKRADFREFNGKLPELESFITTGTAAVRFIESLVAVGGHRTYLVLFQNSSELRPTGGFPGSYAVLSFDNGKLIEFFADDIYNPDGQIKEKIVPPLELQHITPTWGMRDASWFDDFPTSAKKVMELYGLGSSRMVDGVIAINPAILKGILEVTGPISMPQYDMVLDNTNFLPQLQAEVEYGLDKQVNQPKKIIMDATPTVLARLGTAPPAQWLKLLDAFSSGAQRHDVLMYMNDSAMQTFIERQGMSGSLRQTDDDYLFVTFSNVKGAKADAVTDTSLELSAEWKDGTLEHTLTIMRKHNGGEQGFYRRRNESYVRVLVPDGSLVRDIQGNDQPSYLPIVTYDGSFQRDKDLEALESTYRNDVSGVTHFSESGKDGFGFWMGVEPGQTQTVRISWTTPGSVSGSDWRLLVQKQPGLKTDFGLTLTPPSDTSVAESSPALISTGHTWRWSGALEQDTEFSARIH